MAKWKMRVGISLLKYSTMPVFKHSHITERMKAFINYQLLFLPSFFPSLMYRQLYFDNTRQRPQDFSLNGSRFLQLRMFSFWHYVLFLCILHVRYCCHYCTLVRYLPCRKSSKKSFSWWLTIRHNKMYWQHRRLLMVFKQKGRKKSQNGESFL